MLELKNIHKSFGDVRVLNGVNLCLEKGRVYTLKGGNGSGKTTLINIISGFRQFYTVYPQILGTLSQKLGTMTIQNTQLVKSNK
ncbi:hypothetical protein AGMMS49965_03150 [Bacteroidia bacterium]|nr:hypothetical protein AGMMS49965_03150 [Bacteroidia bacterium]